MDLFALFKQALDSHDPVFSRSRWQRKVKGAQRKTRGFRLRHVRKDGAWVLEVHGATGPPTMSSTFYTDSRGRRYNVYSDGSHRRVLTARGGRSRV